MHWKRALVLLALCPTTTATNAKTIAQQRSRARNALAGKTIRVSFTNPESPLIFREEGTGMWIGVLPDFLKQLIKEAGFIANVTAVSEDSIAVVGTNLNTACPRDISLNRTDLCIGNPWVTTQRLGYASVLPTFWQEKIYLTVRLTEGGFRNAVLQTFKPFDMWLWLAITLVMLCYSATTWYVEHKDNNRDFPDKGILTSGATSLYHGAFGFFWSEPPTRPVTAEGRILAVGFGLFIVLMLSSYTASLASVLVNQNMQPEFANLRDAIDGNTRICMRVSMLSRAAKIYPRLPDVALAIDSWIDGYNRLDIEECGGMLIASVLHAKQQESNERDCNKVQVGEPAFGINCAWFAAEQLASPLSFFISELMGKGILDELVNTWSPRVLCSPAEEAAEGLSVNSVVGILFITAAFMVAGVAVHCFKWSKKSGALKRLSNRLSRARDSRGSGSTRIATTGTDVVPEEVKHHTSRISVPAGTDPSLALVRAFHEEPLLRELPFEKTLLVIGQARWEANEELAKLFLRFARGGTRNTWADSVKSRSDDHL